MPVASGWRARWWRCSAGERRSWSTTTTTSPGGKSTAASASTWCARARRPRSRARKGSSADPWVKKKGVVLRGGGTDESPHVYRRLPDVLAAQGPTVQVLHVLRPLIVVMAGAEELDPYKD